MGKSTTTSAPSYPTNSNGTISINGTPIATSSNGVTNYQLSDIQNQAYNYAQNAFADNLSSVNSFSPETLKNLYSQVDAYRNKGIAEINNVYNPMINSLKTDIASRFGNFNNSSFLNNLNTLENSRANSISALAQDVTSRQNELVNDELSNRYQLLSFLNNYTNQVYNNALSAMGLANNTANQQAQYQNSLYNALYKQYATNSSNTSNLQNTLLSAALTGSKFFL